LRPEDLLALAAQIVAAEEGARLAAESLAESLAERVSIQVSVAQRPERTKVVRLRDVELPRILVEERGAGRIRELAVKSRSPAFALKVLVDGELLYDDDFYSLKSVSQEVEGVDAFEQDGSYVVRLSGISFSRSARVEARSLVMVLSPGQPKPVLDHVLCVIDLLS